MANQVYEVTHSGLAAVMSAKAATLILRKAIESEGHDSSRISGSEMRDVLMGSIYQELKGILPKDGVERTLKQIIKTLKKQAKAAKEALAEEESLSEATDSEAPDLETLNAEAIHSDPVYSAPTDSAPADSDPVHEHIIFATQEVFTSIDSSLNSLATDTNPHEADLPLIQSNVLLLDEDLEQNDDLEPSTFDSLNFDNSLNFEPVPVALPVVEPVPIQAVIPMAFIPRVIVPQAVGPVPQKERPVSRTYSQQELEQFMMHFAQVEHIKIVALVQNNGVIKESRGSGFDLAAISRIGSMGLKLLSRQRTIHSFYLSHQKGQLFLFPLADHTLIVVGNSEVNVGEVFSTLSILEESL